MAESHQPAGASLSAGREASGPLAESLLPLEPHGILAVMAGPTVTPTPFPVGQEGCGRWTYTLKYDRPSKMASLKNALGKWVSLFVDYLPPGTGAQSDWPDPTVTNPLWDHAARTGPKAVAGNKITYCDHFLTGFQQNGTPIIVAGGGTPGLEPETGLQIRWSWTVDWGSTDPGGFNLIYRDDPGIPFTAYDSTTDGIGGSIPGVSGLPIDGVTPGTWPPLLLPQDVVGNKQDRSDNVNWGLLTYHTPDEIPDGTPYQDFCGYDDGTFVSYKLVVKIDTRDTGKVDAMEAALNYKYLGGLDASGGTPTKGALAYAKNVLHDTFAGGPLSFTGIEDPKGHCDRLYANILCTDGLSNTCNPDGTPPGEPTDDPPGRLGPGAGQNWVSPCDHYYPEAGCFIPADPIFGRCCDFGSDPNGAGFGATGQDGSGIANDCTTNYTTTYTYFPPGPAEDTYNTVLTHGNPLDSQIRPRTFVIGISPIVGKCELNYTAYRGMTDASSPNFDGGIRRYDPGTGKGDPRLRWVGEDGTTPDRYGMNQALDYAFFALNSTEMATAVRKIVAGSAAGQYTTSAPTGGGAVSSVEGNIVLLASTDFPSWQGHLTKVDVSKDPQEVQWDAGELLAVRNLTANPRKLYSWDPSTNVLIPIDRANKAALAVLAGVSNDDKWTRTIDFIQGFTGKDFPLESPLTSPASTQRNWSLGPTMNSTPALVPPPVSYRQTKLPDHKAFENAYSTRVPLTWVGADDGFLHAFRYDSGDEVLALMPPGLLKDQPFLRTNYLNKESETGQNIELDSALDTAIEGGNQHYWGVANSLHYYDVYTGVGTGYKTLGALTVGPAGDTIAAIDITHATLTDPHYGQFPEGAPTGPDPVQILWTVKGSAAVGDDFNGLYNTWSVPAMSATAFDKVTLLAGGGLNYANALIIPDPDTNPITRNPNGVPNPLGNQTDPKLFTMDALTGTLIAKQDLLHQASALVGSQAFADGVFMCSKCPFYLPDNIADLGVQADENGQVWFNFKTTTPFDTKKVGIDASANAGQPQPIYYSPAATGIGTTGFQFYAFGSGSFYETRQTVSGKINGGLDGPFQPNLYLVVNNVTAPTYIGTAIGADPALDSQIFRQALSTIPLPRFCAGGTNAGLNCGTDSDCPGSTCATSTGTVGPHTQLTGSPLVLIPQGDSGTGDYNALFLVYDPDAGCTGFSFVPIFTFHTDLLGTTISITNINTFEAGAGASSGLVVAKNPAGSLEVFVAKSGVGEGSFAELKGTGLLLQNFGLPAPALPQTLYWVQHK